MEIFLDTADINVISKYKDFIDGVTTNPTLMAKNGSSKPEEIIKKICSIVRGAVSAEVISTDFDEMIKEGQNLAKIHSNVCVKLPCTFDGLKACSFLSERGIATNMTLCFSAAQALMAAKCGATYVSPFVGRIDDIGQGGIGLINEIVEIYKEQNIETKVLAASIRSINHFTEAALAGANAITLPEKVLAQCFVHPLTEAGLEKFLSDWNNRAK